MKKIILHALCGILIVSITTTKAYSLGFSYVFLDFKYAKATGMLQSEGGNDFETAIFGGVLTPFFLLGGGFWVAKEGIYKLDHSKDKSNVKKFGYVLQITGGTALGFGALYGFLSLGLSGMLGALGIMFLNDEAAVPEKIELLAREFIQEGAEEREAFYLAEFLVNAILWQNNHPENLVVIDINYLAQEVAPNFLATPAGVKLFTSQNK
jgi:hypothetical protein